MTTTTPTAVEKPTSPRFNDLEGRKFGRLEARFYVGSVRGNARWHCVCECGNTKVIEARGLIHNHTKSCGCLRDEASAGRLRTHGASYTPEYRAWCHMRERCTIPSHPKYPTYGGRGITVCLQWLTSFTDFLTDVGSRPSAEHSLDRINNDGNYEPSNVRWATRKQQQRNLSTNRRTEFEGEILTIPEIAEKTSISISTLTGRLKAGRPLRGEKRLPL